MDSRAFLGLGSTHNRYRWTLAVRPELCTFSGFLFGGAGLGAAINALEGHQITQARAVGHVGNREILTVIAALGDRPGIPDGQFEVMPGVRPPHDCPPRVHRADPAGTINERLDVRTARGRSADELDGSLGEGRGTLWGRLPDVIVGVDATALAIMGDFVPGAVGQALGHRGGGNSLDNTLRVVKLVPTEWVLLDVRVQGVDRGFGHGLVHMFAEDGTLLATASQSCIVRLRREG